MEKITDAERAGTIRRNAAQERLYTDAEFEAARARHVADVGLDPLVDDTFTTGWHRWTYHGRRWWWTAPWRLTRPWLPSVSRSLHGDEWCNSTLMIILPPLGSVTIRYGRRLRTRADGACDEIIAASGCPNCPLCGGNHWPSCVPVRVICDRCGRRFGETGDTGRFAREDTPHTLAGHLYCGQECASG